MSAASVRRMFRPCRAANSASKHSARRRGKSATVLARQKAASSPAAQASSARMVAAWPRMKWDRPACAPAGMACTTERPTTPSA